VSLARWWYVLPLRLRSLFRRAAVERELDEELRYHLERQTAEHVARGMTPEAARTAALRAMGGVEFQKEQVRDIRGTRWLEDLGQDLRYALRALRRNPGFAAVAVVTLGLGIGGNTALFTLLDNVMLRNLPVRDAGGLVIFQRMALAPDGAISPRPMPYPAFQRMRAENTVAEAMAAVAGVSNVGVRIDQEAELLGRGAFLVTGEFFPLLGLGARVGRLLGPEDDHFPTTPAVVVLSHDYWSARFGRDPGVVGRSIELNETRLTIIGVTPPGFFGVSVGGNPDLYLPMTLAAVANRSSDALGPNRGFLSAIGRLRPGVSRQQASEQLGPLYIRARIETAGQVVDKQSLELMAGTSIAVEPGAQGLSFLRTQFGKPLVILMAMVGVVQLVVCGNIASLLIARASRRRREIGIRLSLGASRRRVVRQLVTESLVLALLGGALGLLVAPLADRVLIAMLDAGADWLVMDVGPDGRILAFALGASLLTGLVFGVAPALRATRLDLSAVGRESARGTTPDRGHYRLGRGLVAAQVALSIVLLVGTGLFIRSLLALQGLDLGFAQENVVIAKLDPQRAGYRRARMTALYAEILQRARAMPGMGSAALADITPLSGSSLASEVAVEGYVAPPGERTTAFVVRATPEYFGAIGLRLRAGTLLPVNRPGAVIPAVVNQAFVRQFMPQGALGRPALLDPDGRRQAIEIVGVVDDSPLRQIREQILPLIYLPFLTDTTLGSASLVLRTSLPEEAVARATRELLRQVDPRLELLRATTLEEQVDATMAREHLVATIATFFGVLALLLASIGLYGVVSQNVARRTNEIGVRMALGASRASVSRQILREAMLTVAAGVAVGVPLSLAAARAVTSLLYGVTPTDATTLLGCVAVLVAVATVASYLPARRASRIDPVAALRAD
jgi:predicted permease